jgi:5'-deoxynucleotidase YfbR-like HD superfamily hydrolase
MQNHEIETVSGIFLDVVNPNPDDIKLDDIAWALSRQGRYGGHTLSELPYSVAQHTVMVSRYIEEALTPGEHLYDVLMETIERGMEQAMLESDDAKEDHKSRCEQQFEFLTDLSDRIKMHDLEFKRNVSLHGLLHDFAEAYIVDLPTPVKRIPGLYEAYKKVERNLDEIILKRFKFDYVDKWPGMRRYSDYIVGWADMYALMVEAYHFMPSRGLTWNLPGLRPQPQMLMSFRFPISAPIACEELKSRYEELKHTPIYD